MEFQFVAVVWGCDHNCPFLNKLPHLSDFYTGVQPHFLGVVPFTWQLCMTSNRTYISQCQFLSFIFLLIFPHFFIARYELPSHAACSNYLGWVSPQPLDAGCWPQRTSGSPGPLEVVLTYQKLQVMESSLIPQIISSRLTFQKRKEKKKKV